MSMTTFEALSRRSPAHPLRLVTAADLRRTAAEAMVRAGHSLHRHDRARGLLLAGHPRLRLHQECRFAGAALCRIRLRRARHDPDPDLRRHRPQRRRHLRRCQLHRAVLHVRARLSGLAHGDRHPPDRRGRRRCERRPDRLSQGAAVPDHAGDADHPACQRQSAERALRHRVRHQFDRQRCLGLSQRRHHPRRAGQCRDADRRPADRPHLSQPLALRLASDRDRRLAQGGAPCRHPRRTHTAGDLYAVGHAVRARRRVLRGAPGQHGFDHRPRLGIPGGDCGRARRRVGRRRARHGLAGDDRRDHHLRADQRSRPHGHPGLRHLGCLRDHPAGRRQHRRQMGEEPRQGDPEDLRQPGARAVVHLTDDRA